MQLTLFLSTGDTLRTKEVALDEVLESGITAEEFEENYNAVEEILKNLKGATFISIEDMTHGAVIVNPAHVVWSKLSR